MRKTLVVLLTAMLTSVTEVAIPTLAQGFDDFDDCYKDECFSGFISEGFFDRFDDGFDEEGTEVGQEFGHEIGETGDVAAGAGHRQ
jgi:hypothetical protein